MTDSFLDKINQELERLETELKDKKRQYEQAQELVKKTDKMINEAMDEYIALNYSKKVKPLLNQKNSKGKLQKLHLNIHPLDISIGNTSFGNIISSSFENIGLELRRVNLFLIRYTVVLITLGIMWRKTLI